MNIRVVPPNRLTADEISAWSDLQRGNPLLQNPYFRPEYAQAVGTVRDDMQVAVMEEGGAAVGFFPFQRSGRKAARPAGGKLSDFQGVIAAPGRAFDPRELLRACGLRTWSFDHLLEGCEPLAPFVWRYADSPYIELTDGFAAYSEQMRKRGDSWSRMASKRRKLERELGTVRFEPHTTSLEHLNTLLAWKTDQYIRTESPDIVGVPWVRRFLEILLEYRGVDFAPLVSVLWAGERPVAMSYSLRSGDVVHSCFPAFDRELQKYSPGVLLLIETLKEFQTLGFRRYDLGRGPEQYKRQYMTGCVQVGEGSVDLQPAKALLRQAWRSTTDLIRSSPFYGAARASKAMYSKLRGAPEYR